jgi:hypothetical protein
MKNEYIIVPISNKEFLARVHAGELINRAEDALKEKERQQEELYPSSRKSSRKSRPWRGSSLSVWNMSRSIKSR